MRLGRLSQNIRPGPFVPDCYHYLLTVSIVISITIITTIIIIIIIIRLISSLLSLLSQYVKPSPPGGGRQAPRCASSSQILWILISMLK